MTNLGYKIVGSGEQPVVIMHEWLGDHTNYDSVLPYLNQKDFSWIFIDLRGYGMSKHIPGDFTCDEAADDVQNLMDHLGLTVLDIVGHSMSAMVAQRIAADTPKRIKTLVLVTPVPASGVNLTSSEKEGLKNVINDDTSAIMAIDARTGNRYNATWLKAKLAMARKASTFEARAGYLEMFLHSDFHKDVIGLELPVRVIVGNYDIPVFQEKHIKPLFSHWYPNLTIEKCQESGHYPMLECPVLFASTLERFVSDKGIR
jgi:pimeloyl-ACP methyl ester carboxylesterase